MHIPDAILSPAVAATTGVIGVAGLMVCVRRVQEQLRDRTTVLMGTMASFVFAAQMVNFPLFPLPISGHLLDGVLSAVILGPWAGAVVIAAVLIVQCLLFGDGGLTALGANFMNMGLVGSVCGYAIYAPIRRGAGGRERCVGRCDGRSLVQRDPGLGSFRHGVGRFWHWDRIPYGLGPGSPWYTPRSAWGRR